MHVFKERTFSLDFPWIKITLTAIDCYPYLVFKFHLGNDSQLTCCLELKNLLWSPTQDINIYTKKELFLPISYYFSSPKVLIKPAYTLDAHQTLFHKAGIHMPYRGFLWLLRSFNIDYTTSAFK